MKWLYTLMLAANLWFIGQLPAQKYQLNVQQFSMEDGLSNRYINTCIQDEKGFIWIGTLYGLCRFNGYDFDVFTIADSDLRVNNVVNIYQDLSGLIWVTNFYGPVHFNKGNIGKPTIDIINPQTLEITRDSVFLQENAAPFSLENLIYFNQTPDKVLWFVTRDWTLYTYDGKAFKRVATLSAKLKQSLWQMHVLQDEIWFRKEFIYTDSTLYGINTAGQERNLQLPDEVLDIWIGNNDTMWVVHPPSFGQLSYKSAGASSFRQLPIAISDTDDSKTVLMKRDQAGRFWYLNNGWLHVLSPSGKRIGKFGTETGVPAQPNWLMIDEDGNAWVGASDGLYILTLEEILFENYYTSRHIDARGIWIDEAGNMYSAQGGLFYKNKKELGITSSAIDLFHEDNYLWIGAYHSEITRYNLQTQQVDTFDMGDSPSSKNVSLYTIYRSKRTGRLWIGSLKGLDYLDTASASIVVFETENEALKEAGIYHFYENESGLWLSTTQGLFLLDEDTQRIVAHYGKDWETPFVSYLYEDEEGIFWIATWGGGLWRWDRANDHWQQITREDGLSNDVIYAVYEDDFGYLWLPSNYGLMQFDKATQSVATYLPKDGLASIEFNFFSHFQAEDGRLYFGGLNGISAFYPRDFAQLTENDAALYVSSFQKLNSKTGEFENHTPQVLQNKAIVLRPNETSFLLRFALLDYEALDNNRFAFKIEGLEEEWNHISENFIRMGRLPYGDYTLHIRGKGSDGQWSKNQLAIPITVITPFYLRTWFVLLVSGLVLLTAWLIVWWNITRLKRAKTHLEKEVAKRTAKIEMDKELIEKQTEKLQELDKAKSRFFINVSHEIRTPLTLTLGELQSVLQQQISPFVRQKVEKAAQNARRLTQLVEEILNLSKLEAAHLQLEEEPLGVRLLIRQLFFNFKSYADLHNIRYQLVEDLPDSLYLYLDRSKFEKIVNNLISNALKFTSAEGEVRLTVRDQGNQIQLEVSDTGSGIHPDDLPHIFDRYFQARPSENIVRGGMGVGLSLAKEYAQLMAGKLAVESTPGQGSTFYFTFLKKEAPKPVLPTNGTALTQSDRPYPAVGAANGQKGACILIVEDHPDIQRLIGEILGETYRLAFAENGKVAIQQLQALEQENRLPSLIVTDLMMPEMDGFALVEWLKSHDTWHRLPVIVLTARANQHDKLKLLRMGVDDYLYKPFDQEELLVQAENLIRNYNNRLSALDDGEEEAEEILSSDQKWLIKLEETALELLEQNPGFKIADIAEQLHVSERHLRRKIRQLIGLTPNEYIREIKLQKAKQLLEQRQYETIREITYVLGFSSSSYFAKIFQERFGCAPSDYQTST